MRCFKLGSTVINLFAPGKVNLAEQLQSLSVTKIGEPLAISTEPVIEPEIPVSEILEVEVAVEQQTSPSVENKTES